MHANKTLLATAAASLTTLMLAVGPAAAEEPFSISANIGAVSNYMWRGVTQTGDQAAIQGGLDLSHESGFYAGTWISNIDWGDGGAYEIDGYLGFGGNVNDDLSYDVNAIYYAYPSGNTRDSDFAELGGSVTWKWFTLGLAYTVYGQNDGGLFDDGDMYYYGGFEYGDLPFGLTFAARGGYYDFRHDEVEYETGMVDSMDMPILATESADYWNFGASISKDAGDFGTFSFNWDQNNGKQEAGYDTNPKFWVGWSKEF